MRRSTTSCSPVVREQRKLLRAIARFDAAQIVSHLDALITPERRARVRGVIAGRLASVTAVMDAPHDPHNGAAVLRSCDAFGVQRLHVIERRETFLAATSVARGSERWVDIRTHATSGEAIALLRAGGYELIATHPDGTLVPDDLASIPRLAVVLGNERDGIEQELMQACSRSVRVPMRGFAESLNVSVTAAILLARAAERRPGDLSSQEQDALYARALVLSLPHAPEVLAARGMQLDLDA
jgi:tRNA (guanosine-2'-O-)-methyltransferase